jgi:hypothetical protein
MLKHYLLMALRNLLSNKLHTALNVGGMALGLAARTLEWGRGPGATKADDGGIYMGLQPIGALFGGPTSSDGVPNTAAIIIGHEFGHGLEVFTRWDAYSGYLVETGQGPLDIGLEAAPVKYVENPLRALLGEKPRTRYTAGDAGSFRVERVLSGSNMPAGYSAAMKKAVDDFVQNMKDRYGCN